MKRRIMLKNRPPRNQWTTSSKQPEKLVMTFAYKLNWVCIIHHLQFAFKICFLFFLTDYFNNYFFQHKWWKYQIEPFFFFFTRWHSTEIWFDPWTVWWEFAWQLSTSWSWPVSWRTFWVSQRIDLWVSWHFHFIANRLSQHPAFLTNH